MSCERFREQIPECLAGRLDSVARENLIAHLELCSNCRAGMAEMGAVWRGLESLPVVEPDPAARARFVEVLEAYQAGMEQARERTVATGKSPWWKAGWWPVKAVWQTALAVALVVAGAAGWHYLARPRSAAPEIAQLQSQVENLRQTVALSMLQDPSSSSRIRGVTYGSQMQRPEREIEQALLYAVNHDSNVNVRLSAVDALEKWAHNPDIQRAMADALPMQDSALVEIALIDVLVEVNDKAALPALHRLADDAHADDAARQRAAAGIRKLEVSQ
jgi:HEAT repeats/Putative zinc-finger